MERLNHANEKIVVVTPKPSRYAAEIEVQWLERGVFFMSHATMGQAQTKQKILLK